MAHTARPFSYYRRVFYNGQSKSSVLASLRDKRIIDVGCGLTPYAEDSMFRACHEYGIEFYGVDPLIDTNITFGFRERALARATGSTGHFDINAPGLERALSGRAEKLPFADEGVDEILCCYLLFVWIEDEELLADILGEFLRVLKPGGVAKHYPLYEWRLMRFKSQRLMNILARFRIKQTFVHGGRDLRVTPAMLTEMVRLTCSEDQRSPG